MCVCTHTHIQKRRHMPTNSRRFPKETYMHTHIHKTQARAHQQLTFLCKKHRHIHAYTHTHIHKAQAHTHQRPTFSSQDIHAYTHAYTHTQNTKRRHMPTNGRRFTNKTYTHTYIHKTQARAHQRPTFSYQDTRG